MELPKELIREYDVRIKNLEYQVQLLTRQVKQLQAFNNYLTELNKA